MKLWNEKGFYRYVLALALPIMLQNGVTNFVGLLDNIMIGRIGTEQMSGVAIINQLLFVFNITLFGATAGPGIFTSQFHGRGSADGVRQTFRFKLIACLGFCAAGIGVFLGFGNSLIQAWLHDTGSGDLALTLQSAQDYLRVMLFGLAPFAIKEIYASTLRETGETVVPMKAAVSAVGINLILNYILIFGKLGLPALGVVGAAIATVVSRVAECAIVVVYTHRHSDTHPYIQGVYRSLRIRPALAADIVRKGLPLLFNELLWSTSMAMLSRCYSERGLAVVAGYNISCAVTNVSCVFFLALGQVTAIIIGNLLGAGKTEDARRTAPRMLGFSTAVCAGVGLVQIALSGVFPLLYNTTDEIRDLARWFILIHGCFQPIFAITNCEYFTLRSGGSVLITFFFDSIYEWVVAVPVAAALVFGTELSVTVIFALVLLCEGLKAILGGIYVRMGKWVRNLAGQYE